MISSRFIATKIALHKVAWSAGPSLPALGGGSAFIVA